MKKISIVIPCFNEQKVLSKLFSRVTFSANRWKYKWEVLCVDDGSTDKTWEMLKKQSKKDSHWKAVSFSRNFGHQTAISCGMFYAKGDAVIIMDADLQDPPEELYRYIAKWQEGYDVVYAVRRNRKESVGKRICYWVFYRLLARMSNLEIPLDSGDFSIIDRKVVDVMKSMPERNRFLRGLRVWSGFKQIGLPYDRQERFAGSSKYSMQKLIKLAMDGIISFSTVPLVIASYFGIVISIIAFLGVIITLLQRIFKDFFAHFGIGPVPGFATIVIAILFLGGVQLIFLGVMGNYLSRIYDEVKGRPHWIISKTTGMKM